MRKTLLPMVASLALCGAATGALVATTARAEQSGHRPTMIALMAPGDDAAAAPLRAEAPPPTRDVMMERAQICKDLYARKAGELAFLEAKLSLTAKQAPLFAHWKQASLWTSPSSAKARVPLQSAAWGHADTAPVWSTG